MTITLDIYGALCVIRSNNADVLQSIRFEFAQFLSAQAATPRFTFDIAVAPDLPAVAKDYLFKWKWRDSAWFAGRNRSQVLYTHGVFTRYDFSAEHGEVFGTSAEAAFERAYYMILSRVQELHERQGFHRMHAFGLALGQKAYLVLARQGGGKSTIGMALLSALPQAKIVCDDTAQVFPDNNVRSFVTHVGMRGEPPSWCSGEFCKRVTASSGNMKTLISGRQFAERTQTQGTPVEAVFILRRSPSRAGTVMRASHLVFLYYLVRDCVIGLGTPQVMELFLRPTLSDVLAKTAILFGRIRVAFSFLTRVKAYVVYLDRIRRRTPLASFRLFHPWSYNCPP